MREKVDKLVEQEMKRTPRKDLAKFPSNFELFKVRFTAQKQFALWIYVISKSCYA